LTHIQYLTAIVGVASIALVKETNIEIELKSGVFNFFKV
jgi:hypothetical protein